jgi:hypothetical protein
MHQARHRADNLIDLVRPTARSRKPLVGIHLVGILPGVHPGVMQGHQEAGVGNKEGIARQGHEEDVRQEADIDRASILVVEIVQHPHRARDQLEIARGVHVRAGRQPDRLGDRLRILFAFSWGAHLGAY